MNWWQIDITGDEQEVLEGVLALHGAEGILTLSPRTIRGFFQSDKREIDEVAQQLSRFSPVIEEVKDKNWVQECEELLTPLVVGNLTVIPVSTMESKRKASSSEILIIPGMGFGTGHHETTSAVLMRMQHLPFTPGNILDFGAGSGILTIAGG